MIPLIVTAHIERGFSAADPWSPSLDSILAALQLQEKIGWQQYALGQSQNEKTDFTDLPLQKVEGGGVWWWACSFPDYDKNQEINRTFYKRFNIDQSLLIDRKVKTIELTKGQFKNYSLSFKEIITNKMQWHCIGDKTEIERLLNLCQQVGAQRGKGLGFVMHWEVKEGGDSEKAKFNRAIPADFAEQNNIFSIKMWRGFRPCFRIVENQTLCVMPL
jgi:CRISPR type IV-associated protein Csf3